MKWIPNRLRYLQISALSRNVAYTLGRQILAAVAQLLITVLIARTLGPQGNGQYAMAILLPSLLVNFLNLGVGPATVYYISRGEVSARDAVRENSKIAAVIAVFGFAFALTIIKLWAESLFPGIRIELLLIGVVAFPLSLLLAYLNTVLQGLEDFRGFNWTILIPPYVTLVCVTLAIYHFDMGITGAVLGYLAGQSAGVATVWLFLAKYYRRNINSSNTKIQGYKRRTLNYGWRAHISNILAFINYRADIFLVNFFLNPVATGLYVIAVQIAEQLWMLSQAVSTVILPRLSAMQDDPIGRLDLTNKIFYTVACVTAAASIAATISIYFLIVPVFGEEFKKAFIPFLCLIPGIIAGAGARVQSNCIAAAGKPEWNMYVAIVVVGLNIMGNILLIPSYGIVGAAIATSGAYIANAVAKSVIVRKTTVYQQNI